ncbi:MAG TPA: hypothetical protein VHT02_09885 [Methylocella sp.]|nr:hypothetical protein [Methylocella sp.]
MADQLNGLVCSGDDSASYIVRGLTRADSFGNRHVDDAGPFAAGLIESILAPDCPVSAALTEQDKADLKKLAKEAQTPESKQ